LQFSLDFFEFSREFRALLEETPLFSGLRNFLFNFVGIFNMSYSLTPRNGIEFSYRHSHIMTLSLRTTALFAEVLLTVTAVRVPLDAEMTAAIRTKGDPAT